MIAQCCASRCTPICQARRQEASGFLGATFKAVALRSLPVCLHVQGTPGFCGIKPNIFTKNNPTLFRSLSDAARRCVAGKCVKNSPEWHAVNVLGYFFVSMAVDEYERLPEVSALVDLRKICSDGWKQALGTYMKTTNFKQWAKRWLADGIEEVVCVDFVSP